MHLFLLITTHASGARSSFKCVLVCSWPRALLLQSVAAIAPKMPITASLAALPACRRHFPTLLNSTQTRDLRRNPHDSWPPCTTTSSTCHFSDTLNHHRQMALEPVPLWRRTRCPPYPMSPRSWPATPVPPPTLRSVPYLPARSHSHPVLTLLSFDLMSPSWPTMARHDR